MISDGDPFLLPEPGAAPARRGPAANMEGGPFVVPEPHEEARDERPPPLISSGETETAEALDREDEIARAPTGAQSRWSSPACRAQLAKMKVAVVGGGLGGLMAARTLSDHGIEVTVFEAHNQVGGRVQTDRKYCEGRIIEMGAELIASFHTEWLALARQHGLSVISRMNSSLYRRAGLTPKLELDKLLSEDEIEKIEKELESRVLRPIAETAQREITVDPDEPWRHPELAHLQLYDKMTVEDALITKYKLTKGDRLWKMVELRLVNDEVAPLDKMNYLGLLCKVRAAQNVALKHWTKDEQLMAYWDELEIFRCADGGDQIPFKLASEIKSKGGHIVTQNAVTRIEIGKDVVSGKEGVSVWVRATKEGDGTYKPPPQLWGFRFDYLVLAAPPSVWGKFQVFVGKDEADLAKTIGILGMADAVKFFSNVKERFWVKEGAAPEGGAPKLGQIWEGSDNQTQVGKQGIVLSVFAGPTVTERGRQPRVPKENECVEQLQRLYKGYAGAMIKPTKFANWPKTDYIESGYASPRVNEIFDIVPRLNKPFHGRMFFAGEHTTMAFFGYMEGALRSGKLAAERVMGASCDEVEPKLASAPATTTKTPVAAKRSAEISSEAETPASAVIARADQLRIETVASKITAGLEIITAALPHLANEAQRDLVRFMATFLNTHFFPKGYGVLGANGAVLQQPRLARITWSQWPRFEHRVRLSISLQKPDGFEAGHYQSGHAFHNILLLASALETAPAVPAAIVALHEAAHMMFWMIRAFTEKFGAEAAAAALGGDPWRMLDLRPLRAQREPLEARITALLRVLPLPSTAQELAVSLLEETFARVLGVIIDEAVASRRAKSGAGPTVVATYDFSPDVIVGHYVLDRFAVPQQARSAPAVAGVLEQLKADLGELARALRAHLGSSATTPKQRGVTPAVHAA